MSLATYVIRIVGVEHGTLQGTVEHIQTGETRSFRGCLEMLRLIETGVNTGVAERAEAEAQADAAVPERAGA